MNKPSWLRTWIVVFAVALWLLGWIVPGRMGAFLFLVGASIWLIVTFSELNKNSDF